MIEQVIFNIEKKIKIQAMRKAKQEGTTYSTILRTATEAYLNNDFEMGFVYSPKLIRDVKQAQKEISLGKGLRGDLRELVKRV